ncbi:sensor histidine kinase [Aquipuribacter hungaricus]|uniref:sensor histidine kinase n=1 Tax=Aquipuribacter hungaricus TaxID=545624 RepID=UPI0036132F77
MTPAATRTGQPGAQPLPGERRPPGPVLRWWRAHVLVVDALWVAGFALLSLLALLAGGFATGPGGAPVPLGDQAALTAVLLLPLVWRRRAPAAVAGVVAAVQFVQLLSGTAAVLPANVLATVSVLFTVAAYGGRDRTWQAFLALALAGCALLGWLADANTAVAAGTTVVGATLAGYLRRIVRVRDEAAVERARRFEVERDSAATVAAEQERRRIARDLHDVIAHSLTVVVAQADGGRYAARTDPDAAVRSLETVAATARGALTDLRTALGVLRSDDASGTAPLPGAADVPDLVASVRGSGHPVTLTVVGDASEVSGGTGLTLYRVVQESLTNVLKHAGPGAATAVVLEHRPGTVAVSVTDDGAGTAAHPGGGGTGSGLDGMRERVAAAGGTLRAGPRAGGGWSVAAELRTGPSPSVDAGAPGSAR